MGCGVEVAFSFSKFFEEASPIFMNMGMTYDQFWRDDPMIAKHFLRAYKLKEKNRAEEMEWSLWRQGLYFYTALCYASPIMHAFAKKGTKPQPYPDKPYGVSDKKKEEKEKEKELTKKEKEAESLRAKVFFKNWARSVNNQFKDKKVGKKNGR